MRGGFGFVFMRDAVVRAGHRFVGNTHKNGGGFKGQQKVCVPEIGLQFPASLLKCGVCPEESFFCCGGCIKREGTSEGGPQAIRPAVGGGCQSGWGRVLSVTDAIEPGTCRQGDSGWA